MLLILLSFVSGSDDTKTGSSKVSDVTPGQTKELHVQINLRTYRPLGTHRAEPKSQETTEEMKDFHFNQDDTFRQLYYRLRKKAEGVLQKWRKAKKKSQGKEIKPNLEESTFQVTVFNVVEGKFSRWKTLDLEKDMNIHCKDLKIMDNTLLVIEFNVPYEIIMYHGRFSQIGKNWGDEDDDVPMWSSVHEKQMKKAFAEYDERAEHMWMKEEKKRLKTEETKRKQQQDTVWRKHPRNPLNN